MAEGWEGTVMTMAFGMLTTLLYLMSANALLNANLTAPKKHYKVGAYYNGGYKDRTLMYARFRSTFDTYLTNTVGPMFSNNITFTLVAMNETVMITAIQNKTIDFVLADPAAISCFQTEFEIAPLSTLRSFRTGTGLKKNGGTVFIKSTNAGIPEARNFSGKIVALETLATSSGGQLQWEALELEGVHLLTDAKQLRFVQDDESIVDAVAFGTADIGFIGGGALESMGDTGRINISDFTVIHRINNTYEDAEFPFTVSTQLVPYWGLAMLKDTDWHVAEYITDGLYSLDADSVYARDGNYSFWQPPLSYSHIRDVHEKLGYLHEIPSTDHYQCMRATNIYEQLVCPSGFVKRTPDEINATCSTYIESESRFICPSGFECFCTPCRAASVVELTHQGVYDHSPFPAPITYRMHRVNPIL
eukprot:jgi/Bigna1/130258/aug1.10_g4966